MYIILAIAGILFILWDLTAKNMLKLVFAGAFLFCAIVAFKAPGNYLYLLLSFPVFAGVFYILIKTILKKERADLIRKNNLKKFEGKIATVQKDIGKTLSIDGIGLIDFENEIWHAKSIDDSEIKAGRRVEIVSRENMIMNVKALEEADCANK